MRRACACAVRLLGGCSSSPFLALQVTAANAQKRRITADNKMKANVTKRGLVTDPAADVSSAAS